jgi:hypothetical protein
LRVETSDHGAEVQPVKAAENHPSTIAAATIVIHRRSWLALAAELAEAFVACPEIAAGMPALGRP